MRFFTALSTIALIIPAFAVPTKLSVKKLSGPVVADSYLITLKKGADKAAHISSLNSLASVAAGDSFQKVTHEWDVVHGYAATLRGAALDHILSSKDVELVEQNGIVTINWEDGNELEARTADSMLTKRAGGGAGVTIYGIDTGVYTAHSCFGGRASWGATYGGYASQDGNGHGTHTAGTAVGSGFGVATSANFVAVKVLSDSGSGTNADVISGVNYAASASKSKGGLAVATMSLGGGASSTLDSAVSSAISGGLHFSIAAGNSNVDASTTSPARVSTANTVGAVDSSNTKASFSNYGSILDIWALGVNVKSAWIGSTTATNTISGTSMATPFVAGVLAVALGEYGAVSPASLSSSLKSHASAVVKGAPSGTTNLAANVW